MKVFVQTVFGTREAFLSEAKNGSVGASNFVDDFVVGASGVHIGCCLNPAGGSF